MRVDIFSLACLACSAHGVHHGYHHVNDVYVRPTNPKKCLHIQELLSKMGQRHQEYQAQLLESCTKIWKPPKLSKVLAMLLLAFNPATAFSPSGLAVGKAFQVPADVAAHRVAHLCMAVPREQEDEASEPANEVQCSFALIKNICGAGSLALPAGISRLSDSGAASSEVLGLAVGLLLVFGALNAFGFLLIGEVCAATSQASIVGAWRDTIGPRTSFIPSLTSLILCFLGAIGCASVIGDVGTTIGAALLSTNFEEISRNSVLAIFSAGILTPLCLLPSLAPLGTASVVGVLGLFVTAGAMTVRFLDGSYAPTGAFTADLITAPTFHDTINGVSMRLSEFPPSAGALFFFLSLISNAYLAHYNAPGIFNECREAEMLKAQADIFPSKSMDFATPTFPAGRLSLSQLRRFRRTLAKVESNKESNSGAVNQTLLERLTSTLAAEEVNELFQKYVESVPSFGLTDAYATGYREGYSAGFKAGYEASMVNKSAGLLPVQDENRQENISTLDGAMDRGAMDTSVGLASFRRVVASAFSVSAVIYLLVACAGFATFGDSSGALILNNYASTDQLAGIARAGILLAVLLEFPLLERAFRFTVLELLLPIPQFTGAITRISNGPIAAVTSVAVITAIAASGVSLDTLAGISGCTGGALLIYIAPALMKLKLLAQTADGSTKALPIEPTIVGLWSIVLVGVALGIVGTADSLSQII